MKFKNENVIQKLNILAYDHFVSRTYDCSKLNSLAVEGVISAGTIIPANDNTAAGVLLNDVDLNDNPNGTIVIHGFINKNKIPQVPSSSVNLPMIQFID